MRKSKEAKVFEEEDTILRKPHLSMEEAFGTGGRVMYIIAKEISAERQEEAKQSRK